MENLEVDAAHDLGGHEPARLGRRHGLRGRVEKLPGPHALVGKQAPHRLGHLAGANVVFGHAEAREIFLRQVDPSVGEVDADVADDVGQLQREPEVERIVARPRVAAPEDLDADQSDRRGHATAVSGQLVEGRVTRSMQVHFDAIDEVVERLARQGELRHDRLEASALGRQGRVGPEDTVHLRSPVDHLRGRDRGVIRLVHRIVHRAAEIPHHADRLTLSRGEN